MNDKNGFGSIGDAELVERLAAAMSSSAGGTRARLLLPEAPDDADMPDGDGESGVGPDAAVELGRVFSDTGLVLARRTVDICSLMAAFDLLPDDMSRVIAAVPTSHEMLRMAGELARRTGNVLLCETISGDGASDGTVVLAGSRSGRFRLSGHSISYRGFSDDMGHVRLACQHIAHSRMELVFAVHGMHVVLGECDDGELDEMMSIWMCGGNGLGVLPAEYRRGALSRHISAAADMYRFQRASCGDGGDVIVIPAYDEFRAAERIWNRSLPCAAPLSEGSELGAADAMEMMRAVADDVGIGAMMDAVRAGVPVDDVIAGFPLLRNGRRPARGSWPPRLII